LAATVIAPGLSGHAGKFDLTVLLARIMFPYLAAMSLVAMLSGVLNSFRKLFPRRAGAGAAQYRADRRAAGRAARRTGTTASVGIALAIGVVLAGLLQLGLLVYGSSGSVSPSRRKGRG
jgi:putative peptidoglycan lipid II flippase